MGYCTFPAKTFKRSLPAGHFMESYFCHSTKVTKNEGAQPLLRCVIFGDAEEIMVNTSCLFCGIVCIKGSDAVYLEYFMCITLGTKI